MFSIFKRGRTPAPESKWTVLQGEHQGRAMVVRRNETAKTLDRARYPHRVGVAVPLRAPDSAGLPTQAEADQLNQIEDALVARLESDAAAVHVLVVTMGGVREFVFYAKDPAVANRHLHAVRAGTASHELQSYVENDPTWTVYGQFS